MKMIKSAVLAVSVLASAGVFAGSAALNVGANAQVESNGGLLGRVGSGVGNIVGTTLHTTRDIATTATGASLGVAGQAVHASRDIAVNATDRAFGVADRVTDRGERSVEQARYEEQRQREQARQYRAEQKARADSRWSNQKKERSNAGVKANTQVGVRVGSINANAGVDTNVSPRNIGVQTQVGVGR
ncbi:hypothetical protein [Acinetobacter soli]|uniref:hypothetical protein n=1 Tax=Acinetobacter soli TaxID=487316 RepID=UPI001D0B85B9|nr:hypothetical protein [Acinetobacter soli]MCB8767768.1 hypothetical protein [Acinetobacter soli]